MRLSYLSAHAAAMNSAPIDWDACANEKNLGPTLIHTPQTQKLKTLSRTGIFKPFRLKTPVK
jgi:hypothetical protein